MVDLTSFDAFCFDLDGTIFIGEALLPYVHDTILQLREKGKKIMFLTNTSTQTVVDCQRRLQRLGLEVAIDEIVTAPYIAGMYLQEFYPAANVFVIGEKAMQEELDRFGITRTENPLQATHLLVGLDRTFTYEKLYLGMKAAGNGAQFIVTNPDPCCPVPNDVIPDTWALAKGIEAAGGIKIDVIIGKPSAYYAQKVLQKLGIESERCLMIGDRLETDILLGLNSGMKTALVLTGVTSRDALENHTISPDYVFSTMGDLLLPDESDTCPL